MSIVPNDLKFYQSSASGSTGGTITGTEILKGAFSSLFPDTTRQALVDSAVAYLKVFMTNTNGTFALLNPGVFALVPPTSGELISLALGTPTDTDPTGLTFTVANSFATALPLLDIPIGQSVAVWIKRTTPAGLPEFTEPAMFQLAVQGETS